MGTTKEQLLEVVGSEQPISLGKIKRKTFDDEDDIECDCCERPTENYKQHEDEVEAKLNELVSRNKVHIRNSDWKYFIP